MTRSKVFLLILVVFIVLATTSSVLVPPGEAPDEVSHFSYADYVSRHLNLPPAEGAAFGQVHQPPLYYGIVAAVIAWIPRGELQIQANPDFVLFDPQTPNLLLHPRLESFPYQGNTLAWHLARLLSVLMGAVTVWATWQVARELLEDDLLAIGAAAFVAFLPEFVFLSSVVNNDNPVVMLSALGVLQAVRVLKETARVRDFVWLGILLGLAPLAKLSGFVVCLFAAILLGWHIVRTSSRRTILIRAAICAAAALLVYAPYALYNVVRYGDPIGWAFLLSDSTLRTQPMTLADFWNNFRNLYISFWARYGGAMQLDLPGWVYVLFSLVGLTALAGWVLYARDLFRHQRERIPDSFVMARPTRFRRIHSQKTLQVSPTVKPEFVLDTRLKRLAILFVLFWVLLLTAHTRWSLNTLGSDQARQLFAGLPLLAIFLTAGFARLFGRSDGRPDRFAKVRLGKNLSGLRLAVLVWSAFFPAAALFMLFTLWSTYHAPVYAAPNTLPALGSRPVTFGNAIQLVDYAIEPKQVRAGDSVTVSAYWQALKPIDQNDWLLLQVFDGGEAIVNKDGVPSAGRVTTDLWGLHEVYSSRHTFPIPPDTAPGDYSLTLGLHPAGTYEWLRVGHADIDTLGTITVVP